uniref:Thioesterase n=1 Tax=uncultured bacterium AZ_379 TaxID=1630015 RepID=A0A0E3JHW4_9BACT|nr:thioesterase [uncultured bacterium AZ_379]
MFEHPATAGSAGSRATDRWLDAVRPARRRSMRLICFPHAGGSALNYRSWHPHLPDWIELCPIQLPGRGRRVGEPLFTEFVDLLPILAEALRPLLGEAFVLFGHSLGALLAFELARLSAERGWPEPAAVFVSGRIAPHLRREEPLRSMLPHAEFLHEIRRLNGTPEDVLEHPELLALISSILRADFRLCETYRYIDGPRLNCALTALGGTADPNVPEDELAAWRRHTAGPFLLRTFPGDHFFVQSAEASLLRFLVTELSALRARAAVQSASPWRATQTDGARESDPQLHGPDGHD